MKARRALGLAAALAGAIGAGACDDTNGPDTSGQPRLTVHLTDAAGDVEAAVVTISEVYLQGGAEGRVALRSEPFTTDLVALAQTTATLVDEAPVPEGEYAELRFVITGGYLEVSDGAGGTEIFASSPDYEGLPAGAQVTGELQMPSLGSSGLKVQFEDAAALRLDDDLDLLVDFDVSQSFGHQAGGGGGGSGTWVMHPVVKGATLVEAATVIVTLGLESGVTLPPVAGDAITLASFSATLDGETVAFTDADGTFEARFGFLLPGTYSLTLNGPAGLAFGTNPTLPVSVTVGASEQTSLALTLTSALVSP